MLPDQRRETFAQNVAIGHTFTEAARRAGFGGKGQVYNTASRLAKEPAVAERIKQLKHGNAEHSDATVASKNWVLCEVIENHKIARANGDVNASRQCLELVARLQGYLTERKQSESVQWRVNLNNPKDLSVAIQAQLASLPPSDRAEFIARAPKELAEAIEIQASEVIESDNPSDNSSGISDGITSAVTT
jgi:hypothetical protein